MMNGWYHDMGAGDWVFMSVFWIALLVVVVWVLTSVLPGRGRPSERPEEILDRRLAAGEVDAETYDKLRAKLRESVEKKT